MSEQSEKPKYMDTEPIDSRVCCTNYNTSYSRQPFSFSIAHQSIHGEFMCQFRWTDENILKQIEIR